jgi:hypothetical protein
MNLTELSDFLQNECYQEQVYHIGSGWKVCADAYCLEQTNSNYEIFYVERGQRGKAIQCSTNEDEVCRMFIELLNRERFSKAHCIGNFILKKEADAITEKLTSAGITLHRDTIPYSSSNDFRYRVFVFGRDKIRAQEVINGQAKFSI